MATEAAPPIFLSPEQREIAELKGPVKQVMQSCYKAFQRDGDVMQGKLESDYTFHRKNFILTLDENKHKTQEELFGSDGRYLKTFNEKDMPVKSIQYRIDGTLYQTAIHTYNERGAMTEYLMLNADDSVAHRSTYSFNDYGQQLENYVYHGRGDKEVLFTKNIYTYVDFEVTAVNGIKYRPMLSNIEYDAEGNIKRQYLISYNEKGKQIESKTVHTDAEKKKYDSRMTQKYNQHGDCIEQIFYKADGSIKSEHTYSYEYDSEGKKIIPPREPIPDPYAKKTGETELTLEDAHGNWIKKTTFYNKVPINMFIREYVYFGEEEKKLVHPHTLVKPEEVKDTSQNLEPFEDADARWLAEAIVQPENFPAARFYAMRFREVPSVVTHTGPYIEAFTLLEQLQENMSAQVIHSHGNVWNGGTERLTKYTLLFPGHDGYLLTAQGITTRNKEEFDVPSFVDTDDGLVHLSQFQLLRPGDSSDMRDESFEEWLGEYIERCSLRKHPEKPTINMVEVSGNSFALHEYAVNDKFEIKDLDLNYGAGFQKFHDDLMHRFHNSTKGLVLFHGIPGTGKTFYIRHLLRKMISKNRKAVIYMPPNMVDHLVEPVFMTFLSNEIRDMSEDGFFCVLLIEDAEPLLAKRMEGVRIQGITNLLNMSDGLLNDMLNLQIICTFNVDVKKLDSALLRPGRLIARKEFKALPELDANILAQRLGIKKQIKGEATLGEIYAMRKDQNIIIHDVDHDKGSSTFIDDLI